MPTHINIRPVESFSATEANELVMNTIIQAVLPLMPPTLTRPILYIKKCILDFFFLLKLRLDNQLLKFYVSFIYVFHSKNLS